jgi:acetoacetyl-CoA synthetase
MEEGFQEAGGDSFMVMELIELAAREGFLLHPETIIRHPTVRRLAGHLAETAEAAKAGSGEGQGPISVLREAPGCPRLFLAHSTPGDVLGYGNLVHALGPGIAVYGFSSLGLTDPAHAHETIEDMAAYYVDHLVKGFPAGPYHLAGWCYGGTVVFEMAAQLARRGHEVGVVGLIDAYAHMPAGRSGKWRYHRRRAWALFRLGPARWFAYLLTKLGRGRQRPVDPEVAAGAAQRVVNRDIVRKKNMEAYYRYRGEGYRGRVTVYLSTETAPDNVYDPRGGWSLYPCTADCLPVTANHRDILKPPAVEEIARHLREAVGRHARAGR